MTNKERMKVFENFVNALNKIPEYKGKVKPVKVKMNKAVHKDVARFIKRLNRAHKLAIKSNLHFGYNT